MPWREKVNIMTIGDNNYSSVCGIIMNASLNPSLTKIRSHFAPNAARLERSVVL